MKASPWELVRHLGRGIDFEELLEDSVLYCPWSVLSKCLNVGIDLEKTMATHSSTLAWRIPWTEEPGRLQSMGSLRVGHDWVTSLSLFTFMHWRKKCNPLQCSCLENPRDGRVWWAAVYGVAQSRTWLKWLSSSSKHWSLIFLICNLPDS